MRKSGLQKLSHALPAARTRLLSDSVPFEMAPIAAFESILSVIGRPIGQPLIATAAAANSAIKLFPSARTHSSRPEILVCVVRDDNR